MPEVRLEDIYLEGRVLRPEQLPDHWLRWASKVSRTNPDVTTVLKGAADALAEGLRRFEDELLDVLPFVAKRRLSQEERRALLTVLFWRLGTISSRRIAEALEMSPETVASARRELEDAGVVPRESVRVGADNAVRPARKQKPSRS